MSWDWAIFWDAASTFVAALAVGVSAWVAFQVHRWSIVHERRQYFIPVWKEMLQLRRIDSADPNEDDVRVALNLLGLVAQSCALKIVEPKVLKEMFADVYVQVYNDIMSITKEIKIGNTRKPGRDFLQDIPTIAANLYHDWTTG